jgi:N-acetylmuramoyl-L-alanine amidase
MIKRILFFFLTASMGITLFSFVTNDKAAPDKKQKIIRTIIVDAGHGRLENGGYHGSRGAFSTEDQICLAISKNLVTALKRDFPEIKIIETRPTERFVANYRRAEIANESKGDLFICIHANAAPPKKHSQLTGYKTVVTYTGKGKKKKKVTKRVPQYRHWTTPNPAKGTETYIWGAHKNEDKEVAMRENSGMLEEENYKENYGDIDPNSPEFIALSLLKTKQYFKRSANLAGFVQDEFAKVGRVDRDVKQRPVGIWVLQATAMPSILVETGYITNREEENYLNSKEGQVELSECITRAVKTYVDWLEKQQLQTNADNGSSGNQKPSSKDVKAFLNGVEQKEKKGF